MVRKLRETISQRKGFTLVELVVVLIILAILAAMLAPSLMGYIDKAKDKRVMAEVHQAVIAAQTLADETYALAEGETPDYASVTLEDVADLAETFAVYPSLSGSITEAARRLVAHDDLE